MLKIKKEIDPLSALRHEVEEIKLEFVKVADAFGSLARKVDTLQNTTNLIFQDRSLLEDIQAAVRSVQDVLLSNRQHQDMVSHDLKADVAEVHDKVEKTKKDVINKVEDVQDTFEENTSELIERVAQKKDIIKQVFWEKISQIFRR